MDSLGIKLPASVPSRSRGLRDPIAVREAVESELGPTKAVSATSDSSPRNREQRRHDEAFARDVIDAKNAEALLRAAEHPEALDMSRNQVLMRQRAYHNAAQTKQPAGKAAGSTSDPHADIEV